MSDEKSSIPEGFEYYKSRRQSFEELFDRIDLADSDEDAREDAQRELDEMPLSIEVIRHVEILLGTGGPADWLDAELDGDGNVSTVTYEYHWGSESFRRTLSQSDAMYRYAEQVAEMVIES